VIFVIFVAFPGLVIAFQSRADVPELTGSQERWNIGTDDNLTGAGPDRLPNTGESGLPSAALGAGASILTRPSAVRGVPAVACRGHCAEADEESNERGYNPSHIGSDDDE
jgi:hypothetical protein